MVIIFRVRISNIPKRRIKTLLVKVSYSSIQSSFRYKWQQMNKLIEHVLIHGVSFAKRSNLGSRQI